jgi:hypothetical protein
MLGASGHSHPTHDGAGHLAPGGGGGSSSPSHIHARDEAAPGAAVEA